MATTIDWGAKNINVQQADLLQIQSTPVAIYEHNIDDFRKDLADLLDDPTGIPYDDTHKHTAPVTLSGIPYARLLEIINGYTVTYLPDTPWTVNITGGNSNIGDRKVPNNVSIQTANSAGLQDSTSIQAGAFDGHVTIDVIGGVSGTTFPRGTDRTPVNNLTDAVAICIAQGLIRMRIVNSMTIDTGTDLSAGYTFYSDRLGVVATIDTNANVTSCSFEHLSVTGILDSNNSFISCEVFDASSLQAVLVDCGLSGTLTLGGGGLTELINCHSSVAGGGAGQYPIIDMGGSGNDLLVRDWSAGLGIVNMSDANTSVSLDFDSGRLVVDSSVTDGTITVRGICAVTSAAVPPAVVIDQTLTKSVGILPGHIWGAAS